MSKKSNLDVPQIVDSRGVQGGHRGPPLRPPLTDYDAFILDLWGVVHDGIHPYPGVVGCINSLIQLDKSIIFLSNTPRPGEGVQKKLEEFGISVTKTEILTSGDLVREQLKTFSDDVFKHLGRRCFHLGASRNKDILTGINVETGHLLHYDKPYSESKVSLKICDSLQDADFILLTAYLDEGEDLEQFDALFKEAATLQLPLICANPDTIIMNGDKLRYCAGFFAKRYEKIVNDTLLSSFPTRVTSYGPLASGQVEGRRESSKTYKHGLVHYYGKPYPAVYLRVFEILKEKGICDKNRILMVGDTLETDILGANNAGIDSALTMTGNTALYLAKHPDTEPMEQLNQYFSREKIKPTWILSSLSF